MDLNALPNAYYSTKILKDGIILRAEAQTMIKFEPVCPLPDSFGGKAYDYEFCYKHVFPVFLLNTSLMVFVASWEQRGIDANASEYKVVVHKIFIKPASRQVSNV